MTPIDLLINPHSILQSTLPAEGGPPGVSALSGMGLAIQERHIIALDTPANLSAQYQPRETLDLAQPSADPRTDQYPMSCTGHRLSGPCRPVRRVRRALGP
jgi:hypothetical protein